MGTGRAKGLERDARQRSGATLRPERGTLDTPGGKTHLAVLVHKGVRTMGRGRAIEEDAVGPLRQESVSRHVASGESEVGREVEPVQAGRANI